jgi:hypothetical protein
MIYAHGSPCAGYLGHPFEKIENDVKKGVIKKNWNEWYGSKYPRELAQPFGKVGKDGAL